MLPLGTLFADRYEILRCISAGGMGTVYEVVHRETRRRRALKVMLPSMVRDADLRRRFALEAQVTADVESEHLVETFDAGIDADSGCPFLVMELLRGEDLGSRLARLQRLQPSEVVGLLRQAASALDKTHSAGIVHRDLKPENLFVSRREDGSLRLKILDFGIAKVVRETEVGKATRSMGTPLYMAPEQFEGEPTIGPAVDRYALGHIAYTLLVGEPYWAEEARSVGNALALMARVAKGPKEPATARATREGVALPEAFDAWFARAVAHEAAGRFESAGGQIVALAEALGEEAALSAPTIGDVPTDPGGRAEGGRSTPRATPRQLDLAAATTEAEPSGRSGDARSGDARSRDAGGSGDASGSRTVATAPGRPGRWLFAAGGAAAIGAIAFLGLREGPAPAPAAPTGAPSAPPPVEAPPIIVAPAASPAPSIAAAPGDELPGAGSAAPAASASATPPPPAGAGRPPRAPGTGAGASTPPRGTGTASPEPWRTR